MQLLNLKNNYTAGKFAELLAKMSLVARGYRVVASRYSAIRGSGAGEVDIIAKRGRTLAFVEVKKRATIDLAEEAIFNRQKNRIYYSAEAFLAKHPEYSEYDCRFDAVCFDKFFRFRYIQNAWGM